MSSFEAPTSGRTSPDGRAASVVPRFLAVSAQWAWRSLVVAAAFYLLLRVASMLRFVVIPIFLALVIAALLEPVVGWLSKRLPRLLATWMVVFWAVVALAALVLFAVGPVVDSARDLTDRSKEALDRIRSWLTDGPVGLDDDQVDDIFDRVGQAARDGLSGFTDSPTSTALFAFEIVGAFFLSLVLTFFFVKDGPQMWSWLLTRVRPARREPLDTAGRAAVDSLQGWVRGTAITGIVDGLIIGLALWLLDVPAALPLAIFTFLGAFFPIVGATIAGALAAGVALADSGPQTAIIVAIVVLVVQQVEGDLLLPLVMYRQVALHPVVILLALATGGAVGGIIGALVSVPLTAATTAAIGAIRTLNASPPGDADAGDADAGDADDRSSSGVPHDIEPATSS